MNKQSAGKRQRRYEKVKRARHVGTELHGDAKRLFQQKQTWSEKRVGHNNAA